MDMQNQDIPRDAYDFEDDRENVFVGPATQWLRYISEEKDLLDSFDLERANNLSLHLYNAHAVKAMHYDGVAQRDPSAWRNKQLWLKTKPDGTRTWVPPQSWTAWPMSAKDVPRPEERHGNLEAMKAGDHGTYKKHEPWFPSADLEEKLLGLLLRAAKDQVSAGHSHLTSMTLDTLQDQSGSSAAPSSDGSSQDTVQDMKMVVEPPSGLAPRYQLTDDDDEARRLLMPTTRHIMSSLDDLLLALHKSRASKNKSSEPGTATAASRKRKRSSVGRDLNEIESAEVKHTDVAQDSKIEPLKLRPLRTRDWSEVLGIAVMAGIDNDVIVRTAQRCSALFKEDITLRSACEQAVVVAPADKNEAATNRAQRAKQQHPVSSAQHEDPYIASVMEELSYFGRHRHGG